MSGVYILNNISKNKSDKLYVKIGCSKDISKRVSQIRSSFRFNGNLDELSLYKTIECKNYKGLEKILHQIMKSRKITNEWFLTEEQFLECRLDMVDLSRYN
jgi:transcription elongation factor GreA-like protein